MIAIFKRELSSLFRNVIGWLFVAVTIAFYGLYFTLNNLMYGAPSIAYNLSAITLLFFIAVPILSMRMFAEDKKNKTDQLWLTAPISVFEVVLGKYLALAACLFIPSCFIALTPLLLKLFGKVSYVESYAGLLGFFLYGLTCMAIALFVSALTESQVIAAVISFAVLFLGFWMSNLVEALFPNGGIIADILKCYDFSTPMDEFTSGTISLVGIVYFVSIAALFLFLTVQVIQKRRWSVSARKLSGSVFSASAVVVAIAAAILVNVAMPKLPSSYTTFDLSKKKLYTMTDEAKKFIKSIDEDITIYAIGTKSQVKDSSPELAVTLRKASETNSHIKVKYVDTTKNPGFVADKTGGQEELYTGSLIVESEKRTKTVSADNIVETEMDYESYSQKAIGYDGEGQLVSALNYVTTDKMPTAYILSGHEEIGLEGEFLSVLEKRNIQQKTLKLIKEDKVPKDAGMVIINAPQSDISKDDAKKLKKYVKDGGKVFVSLEFSHASSLKNLKKFLKEYDIDTFDGVVADPKGDNHFQSPYYLLPNVESSQATADVQGDAMIFSPFTVGFKHPDTAGKKKAKITFTDLLTTSPKAFSKASFSSDEEMSNAMMEPEDKVEFEDDDIKGPFCTGVQADIKNGGSVIAVGSSYMLTSQADEMVSGHNSKLFDGIISVLSAGEDDAADNSISIPVKKYDASRLTVPAGALRIYAPLFVVAIPLLCVICGVVIFILRRRR